MKLDRRKKVPASNRVKFPADTLGMAKDGDDVRLFIVADGVVYEVTMLKRLDLSSSSQGTNDHGLLTGLGDDDHTQYTKKSILTAKGDIYVATASATVTRKGAGTNNYPLVADSGEADGLRYGGNVTISGALAHTGSTKGSYGVTPTARPSAYTQTYSTASRTHSNPTASSLTDNSGGAANTTIEAMPDPADTPILADDLRDDIVANLLPAIRNNVADIAAQINALIADVANVKQVLNQVIDDFQLEGSLQ